MIQQKMLWFRWNLCFASLALALALQSCSIKDGDAMADTNFILANQLFFDSLYEKKIEIFVKPMAKPTVLHVESFTVVLRPLRTGTTPIDELSDNFVQHNHQCIIAFVCYNLDKNTKNADKNTKLASAIIGLMSKFNSSAATLADLVKKSGVNSEEAQSYIQNNSSQYQFLKKSYSKDAEVNQTVYATLTDTGELHYHDGSAPIQERMDVNADGKVDQIITYNGVGSTIKIDTDNNWDGEFDEYQYYDGKGGIVRLESDTNFDGKVDEVIYYQMDQIKESKQDVDYNGIFDVFTTYEFDVIRRSEIRPNDSKYAFKITEYTDNCYIEYIDNNQDGKIDSSIKYDNFERVIEKNEKKVGDSPRIKKR